MAYESLMVFTGNANPLLAHSVVRRLTITLELETESQISAGANLIVLHEYVSLYPCIAF